MANTENGFLFIWKIENFSLLPLQFDEKLESQTFIIDAFKDIDFFLELYPRGYEFEDFLEIYVCTKQEDTNVKLSFSITLESTELSKEKTGSVENELIGNGLGFPNFLTLSEVFSNKDLYLPQDTLTLRCDIISAGETHAESIVNKEPKSISTCLKKYCVSRTCIEVQRRYFTWSINNVKKIPQRLEETSVTTPFLKLIMVPNKKKIPGDNYIQILIQQTSVPLDEDRLFVRCKITLISAHRQYQAFKESTHLFESDSSDVWTFPPFITTSMLMDKNDHFEDDTLTLLCEFSFSSKNEIHHLENNYMPLTFKTEKQNSQLSTCFENIYADRKFCDIELKVGNKTFHYNKLLLCARSSVFAAMFQNNMREKNSNVVEIEDVDADTVQRMLTYMHSDVLDEDMSPEDIGKLYAAADKYDIGCMKQKCAALLMSTLSVESVCEILVLADDHQDGLLMTAACEFISSHTNEVLHLKQWKSLMGDRPELTSIIMHQILTGKYPV